jgi:hypothetical protein
MNRRPKIALALAMVVVVFFLVCLFGMPHHKHALVGCWQAEDSTVFVFRDDGTFIGRDFRGRRIFGNWVGLNKEQIGFQSLMHGSFYSPQYAEVTSSGMRYAYSDSPGFIDALSVDPITADRQISLAKLNQKSRDP